LPQRTSSWLAASHLQLSNISSLLAVVAVVVASRALEVLAGFARLPAFL
jgi:hypothetical protein